MRAAAPITWLLTALFVLQLFVVVLFGFSRSPRRPIRLALLSYATGPYSAAFRESFVRLAETHLCVDDASVQVQIFFWTDEAVPETQRTPRTVFFPARHRAWPHSSLARWQAYLERAHELRLFDHVVAADTDLFFSRPLCGELLADLGGALVAWHEGSPRAGWPVERNVSSVAAVSLGELERMEGYFSGALLLASGSEFVRAVETCRGMAEKDAVRGVMPVWHDESYWNKYLAVNRPTRVLSGEFVYPQPPADLWLLHTRPSLWLKGDQRARKPAMMHMRKPEKLLRGQEKEGEDDASVRVCRLVTVVIATAQREDLLRDMVYRMYLRHPCLEMRLEKVSPPYNSYIVRDNSLLTQTAELVRNVPTELAFLVAENWTVPRSFNLERAVRRLGMRSFLCLGDGSAVARNVSIEMARKCF